MGYKPASGIGTIDAYRKRSSVNIGSAKSRWSCELGLHHIPLILLYVLAGWQAYVTAGNPYRTVLATIEESLEQEELDVWDKFGNDFADLPEDQILDSDGDGLVDVPLGKLGAKEKRRLERERLKQEQADALEADPFAMLKGKDGMFPDWFGIEDEEEDYDPDRPPLPSPFLPDFWPTFFLIVVMCSHALLALSEYWSVSVRCYLRFAPLPTGSRLQSGMYAKIAPEDARGVVQLVQVTHSLKQEEPCLYFEFQQRRYRVNDDDEQVRLVEADVNAPCHTYLDAIGHDDTSEAMEAAREMFGFNKFAIPVPDFFDLYLEQVARPMCVFQLFCTGLWLLDEAWKYAMFGLFSILTMEGTSVFSRLKHITMIRGMGNKARQIMAFRGRKWQYVSTEDLLPGDLISQRLADDAAGGDIIPCDVLLLQGTAVLNEATLTGESVPQMKEALVVDETTRDEALLMKGKHKVHVLFGGTSLVQCSAPPGSDGKQNDGTDKYRPPDGGCLCYVLQTGFSSSQGKLVRMIEFSSSSNNRTSGDPVHMRESFMLISLLLMFAIMASGYVLYHALNKEVKEGERPRTRYQLLIRCIIIVTSVVPSDLPMQLALAVNASLMQLMRQAVFCIEPFRVPMAGKVDCCFFDKTGTITTDQMQAIGISPSGQLKADTPLLNLKAASINACRVLAGCHSLLSVEGQIQGDPIEVAALEAIGWSYDHAKQTASSTPRIVTSVVKKGNTGTEPITDAAKKRAEEKAKRRQQRVETQLNLRPFGSDLQQVRILHRYHFLSELQRMAVVAVVKAVGCEAKRQVLVKGSPEAILKLLKEVPAGYEQQYSHLVKRGMRVLALAYKNVDDVPEHKLSQQPREWAESDLTFAGFVAFQCLMRKDSPKIISNLRKANLNVVMITGDNMLTAIHAAAEAGITEGKQQALILHNAANKDDDPDLRWICAGDDTEHSRFTPSSFPDLCLTEDLCISGASLRSAVAQCGREALAPYLHHVRVYARMAPQDKELVLACVNANGHTSLMCGDGANDVGALKQAHVGVALLGGFGSLNTVEKKKPGNEEPENQVTTTTEDDEEEPTEEEIEAMGLFERIAYEKKTAAKQAENASKVKKTRAVIGKENKAEAQQVMMQKVAKESARLQEAGESAMMAQLKAVKNVIAAQHADNRSKVAKAGGGFTASAAAMAAATEGMEGMEDGTMPLLKLGDASVAAPFTSKRPSIIAVYDIIRQGRCTLVSRVQNNQIICLTCLISSYSLSVLYLEGVKFSDYQMTMSGMLLTSCHLALSYSSPLKQVASVRPPDSMFHPALFVSLCGQFAIHLASMLVSVNVARRFVPDDYVNDAHGRFKPNLVNSVVFLVQTMQQVSVLLVNYKGRPFQPGLIESRTLLNALGLCCIGLLVLAYEIFPAFNTGIGMVLFPAPELRQTVLATLFFDLLGTIFWDRFCVWLWANHIHQASITYVNTYTLYVTGRKLGATLLTILLLFREGSLFSLMAIGFMYKRGWY